MNELIFIVIFILWYIGSLIVSENISKDSKLGTEWVFFISMLFSPIVGILIKLIFIKYYRSINSLS
ncbi:MAG: hypothetical protein KKG99_14990 [Bacteroidetes bacterium]|nr:hypothetical protein [Bacteroidota bacterium]